MKAKHDMTKNNTKSRVFPIVLKTMIDDAMREKTINDDNAKKIRARLRVAFANEHVKNTSWIATTQREYDRIRCAFDATYATRLTNARKRNTKKNATTSNDVVTTND
jgi:hypothetical protein